MSQLSKSPDRHTFQKDGYVKRQAEKNEPVSQEYLKMFEQILEREEHKFDDLESRKNNLEYDLLTTEWILNKVRACKVYSQNLYAAMCNREFTKLDVIPVLKEEKWSCSWRYAGGIIANMRQTGDYIDWYCSGIRDNYDGGYVGESVVTDEIEKDLNRLGWAVLPENNDL